MKNRETQNIPNEFHHLLLLEGFQGGGKAQCARGKAYTFTRAKSREQGNGPNQTKKRSSNRLFCIFLPSFSYSRKQKKKEAALRRRDAKRKLPSGEKNPTFKRKQRPHQQNKNGKTRRTTSANTVGNEMGAEGKRAKAQAAPTETKRVKPSKAKPIQKN